MAMERNTGTHINKRGNYIIDNYVSYISCKCDVGIDIVCAAL